MSLQWLREFCTQVVQGGSALESTDLLMLHLLTVLKSPALDESSLIDLVGVEFVHLIPELLSRRKTMLVEWAEAKARKTTMGHSLSQVRVVRKKRGGAIPGYDEELDLLAQLGRNVGGVVSGLVSSGSGGSSSNPKLSLPEGTSRHTHEHYEEYRIPAAKDSPSDPTACIPVSDLPLWVQPVFAKDSAFLNRIQSRVFQTAFHSNENFLMCAPTGAGKTNVALLAICRLIEDEILSKQINPTSRVTAVYMAPMKALVAEVVEKFSSKLSHRGIQVREFTGDVSLPRAQLANAHVIVTVPEKWDILMRNLARSSSADEPSFLSQVRLLIIDEIHLLNEERGAVIESIVARTMQMAERNMVPVRFVALSATFPNYEDIARFLGVAKRNVFFFGSEFRPVPLEQTVCGVGKVGTAPRNMSDSLNKVCA